MPSASSGKWPSLNWLFGLKALYGFGKPALGASSGVGVNDALRGSFVQLLGRHAECRLAFLDIARGYRRSYFADLTTNFRLDRAVATIAGDVLTEALLGTFGIGHDELNVKAWEL